MYLSSISKNNSNSNNTTVVCVQNVSALLKPLSVNWDWDRKACVYIYTVLKFIVPCKCLCIAIILSIHTNIQSVSKQKWNESGMASYLVITKCWLCLMWTGHVWVQSGSSWKFHRAHGPNTAEKGKYCNLWGCLGVGILAIFLIHFFYIFIFFVHFTSWSKFHFDCWYDNVHVYVHTHKHAHPPTHPPTPTHPHTHTHTHTHTHPLSLSLSLWTGC